MKRDFFSKLMLGLPVCLLSQPLLAQSPLSDASTASTSIYVNSGSNGDYVVDNTAETYMTLNYYSGNYCRIDLGSAKVIHGYSLSNATKNDPSKWELQGSNSLNSGYTTLDSRNGEHWDYNQSRKFFALSNTTAYRYYRLVNKGTKSIRVAEIELFEDFAVRGNVFVDNNLNNTKDAGEAAIAGTRVWLKVLSSNAIAATKVTDQNGAYVFSGNELDGLELFAITAKPVGNLQPRTEPMPQSGLTFPSLTADGSFLFSNINAAQFAMTGQVNFGFKAPTTTLTGSSVSPFENPNLITNAQNGTFGTTDSSGNAFVLNHPNAKIFSMSSSHPELYSNVSGYTTGANYSFQNGDYGDNGFLWDAGKYVVTDFLGTTFLETGGSDLLRKGILNNMNYGWRVSTGATTGAWNDRFLAVNGSNQQDASLNAVLFADTVSLTAGNTYTTGFYGKSANKWQQGEEVAIPTVIKYFVKKLSTGDTAAMGTIAVQSTTSDATDSVNFGWNKAYTDFVATAGGNYGVYFLVTTAEEAGNDAYFDNFFLRKSSYKISGQVYNDANGLTDNTVNGTSIHMVDGKPLFAYLLDPADNHILGRTTVNANGAYSLYAPEYAAYKVALSTVNLINGSVFETEDIGIWAFTGSYTGLQNQSGSQITSSQDQVTVAPVDAATDIIEVNFGYQQLPESFDRSKVINGAPVVGTSYPLGDVPLQGSDAEDNNNIQENWETRTIRIIGLPSNGFILKYNGVVVHAGDVIAQYDPALLDIIPSANTPAGTLETKFKYKVIDAAHQSSPQPAVYTVTFSQPLPVDLMSFTVKATSDCGVQLHWTSGVEAQFKHYVVERSADGRTFMPIATTGATGSYSNYTYTDQGVTAGKWYYRLQLVDQDNSYAYSNIAQIAVSCLQDIRIYPTLTTGNVQVTGVPEGAVIKVLDVSGRIVMNVPAAQSTVLVDLSHLAAAGYLIGVSHQGHTEWVKVVKQ